MARFAAALASVLVSLAVFAGCLEDEPSDDILGGGKTPILPDREAVYGKIKSLMEGVACEAP
ncbi:MAG TPA: hypothetical protein VI818_06710, partial [Candidatus Thermoplasmatota archaeon]|nr:hypothetical protein [Candidatus Thermoplasmatota archaeon]